MWSSDVQTVSDARNTLFSFTTICQLFMFFKSAVHKGLRLLYPSRAAGEGAAQMWAARSPPKGEDRIWTNALGWPGIPKMHQQTSGCLLFIPMFIYPPSLLTHSAFLWLTYKLEYKLCFLLPSNYPLKNSTIKIQRQKMFILQEGGNGRESPSILQTSGSASVPLNVGLAFKWQHYLLPALSASTHA